MKKYLLLNITLLFAFFITTITAQISTVKPDRACINCPTDEPDANAVLEIQATNKGILIPRVASVVNMGTTTGLLVYDNSNNTFKYYNGTQWVTFGGNLQTTVLGNGNTANGVSSTALGRTNDATGNESLAAGFSNEAIGTRSSALGYSNEASNFGSIAVGYDNEATGANANAHGRQNTASGTESLAVGIGNNATATGAIANGRQNTASGITSLAVGNDNEATGRSSTALGFRNETSEFRSTAVGSDNDATGDESTALGYWNEATTLGSIAVGYNNDATGENSAAYGFRSIASGDRSIAMGWYSLASGTSAIAIGDRDTSSNNGAVAIGLFNKAFEDDCTSIGSRNTANNTRSTAIGRGNTASGFEAAAFGNENEASGNGASAFGNFTTANLYHMTAIGTYNAVPLGSSNTWITTEPAFIVGNGESEAARSTALTILKNGNTGIGTMTPTDAQFIVESEEYDDTVEENVAIFGKSTGTYANIKLLASSRAGIKFIDEGSGVVGESDFMIRMSSAGELEIRNANNADDEFGTSDLVARFETLSDTYQFRVYGDALASGGTWTNSDRRLKKNIKDLDNPLEKIMQLQPKQYDFDHDNAKFQYLNLPEEAQIGLIAQEVEKVLPELVKTDHATPNTDKDEVPDENAIREIKDLKAVNYTALIPVLIGAVQEQQNTIESKDNRIEQLEDRLHKIEAQLAQLSTFQTTKIQLENNTNSNGLPQLQQNQPNPFSDYTIIQYYIPETVQQAQLQFHDLNGKVLKVMEINQKGTGQIELETAALVSGTYNYSLILDGKIFETKRMVLSR